MRKALLIAPIIILLFAFVQQPDKQYEAKILYDRTKLFYAHPIKYPEQEYRHILVNKGSWFLIIGAEQGYYKVNYNVGKGYDNEVRYVKQSAVSVYEKRQMGTNGDRINENPFR